MSLVRIVQVSPFHPLDLEMGGPLHLVRHIATERHSPSFESLGVVAPASMTGRTETDYCVHECRVLWRYRTVNVTTLIPLRAAIDSADLVLIHGYRHWLTVMAAREASSRKIPYVIHLHGMATRLFRSRAKKFLFDLSIGRRLAAGATRIICSSKAEVDKASTILNLVGKSVIIPNAVEPSQFFDHVSEKLHWCQRLGLDPRLPLVTALGRINPTKNFEAVIAAVAGRHSANLLIVGPPEDRAYWKALELIAGQHQLGRILLIPGLYGSEKQSLLAATDVYVTTTHIDSFNLTVAEALFQGTPVIFPSWIGIAEFLDSPISFSVDAVTPDALSTALSSAMQLPRSSDSACCPFTWESIRPRYDRFFQEVAGIPVLSPPPVFI